MQTAVNAVFSPLVVECWAADTSIFYEPPFYFEDKCNEMTFGVTVVCNVHDVPTYPLTCTSECHDEDLMVKLGRADRHFVVQSAADWHNHVDKFIYWRTDYQNLFNKIRDN